MRFVHFLTVTTDIGYISNTPFTRSSKHRASSTSYGN